jgi:peptide/nickel transport system permease protein
MSVVSSSPISPKPRESKSSSQLRDTWKQFSKHKGAVVGMVVFFSIILTVLLGPYFYRIDAATTNVRERNQMPSMARPFGTDNLGRDLLAQNLAGGRISLAVGVTAMLISLTVGSTVGLLAGYYRRLDGILMRLTDLFLALPLLPLLLVIIMLFRDSLRGVFGPQTGIFILIVSVIGLTSWMNTARVVRGEVLAVREREFVMAAGALGSANNRVIWLHILPNVLSPILVSATLGVASAIITESALSFLGLGFPSDVPTWGRLLFDGRDYINITPTRVVWPGVFISLIVLSVNFMGDGLRDALDPKLRGRT